jgi:hypothetical protein
MEMNKKNLHSLDKILSDFIDDNKLRPKLAEIDIVKTWEEIVGKNLASRTKKLFVNNRKLFVSLSTSIARQELMLIREELVKRVNLKAGMSIIDEIVIL